VELCLPVYQIVFLRKPYSYMQQEELQIQYSPRLSGVCYRVSNSSILNMNPPGRKYIVKRSVSLQVFADTIDSTLSTNNLFLGSLDITNCNVVLLSACTTCPTTLINVVLVAFSISVHFMSIHPLYDRYTRPATNNPTLFS
jgi:hypothetical protein